MKAGRPKQILTERELQLMTILWDNPGGLSVRRIVELHPDPKPHVNSVATILKILEDKGHVSHRSEGGAHIFMAVTCRSDVGRKSFSAVVSNFFGNSYRNVISSLVDDRQLTIGELKEIIAMIEARDSNGTDENNMSDR